MEKPGKYLYGIVANGRELRFEASQAARIKDVYTISYQDISAVVSDCEIVDYKRMPNDAMAKLLVEHQRVIESAMGLGYSVVPVRLGTFAADETGVAGILDRGYNLIKDVLSKTADKVEVDVAATWSDLSSILKDIGEEKNIKEFKETLLSNPSGITVNDQMKVGLMVKERLEEKREKYADEIQAFLGRVSESVKSHELMDDKMVVNTAFLVYRDRQKEFDKKLEELNSQFDEKLNFRRVGPLPPYSFYTLEIRRMQFEQIDWARKKLGLTSDFATKNDIKKAHRLSAFSFHPDTNPNTPRIESKFDDAMKAYKILQDYCQGETCSFDEREFEKNAILVKVKE